MLPRCGDDGNITLDMQPTVSFLTGFDIVGPSGAQVKLPQTSERIAQSTMSIKSGETIAIGGLIQDQDRKTSTGIPILMNLPIIGKLFRSTNNQRDRTELVIFITAKEIEGPAMASTTKLVMDKDLTKSKDTPKDK